MLRVTRFAGSITSLAILGLYLILAFFNPNASGAITLTLPIALMMLVAIIGAVAAYLARPYLMLAIALIGLIPIGLYLLGTPSLFRWIGIFDLLYLACAIAIWIEKRSVKSPRDPAPR